MSMRRPKDPVRRKNRKKVVRSIAEGILLMGLLVLIICAVHTFDSYEPSRKWLDTHKLEKIPLYCVDKYGREIINQNCSYNMTLAELYKMDFDFAVEDSPSAFQHVAKFNHCKVAVYNRPWNKNSELPDSRFKRCNNWKEIDKMFEEIKRV